MRYSVALPEQWGVEGRYKIFANVEILPCVLRRGATRIPLGDVVNVTLRETMKNGPRVELPMAHVANAETDI